MKSQRYPVRKDMVEGLKNFDWVIMPRKDTLDTMYQLAKFNETADLESRKNCLEASPLNFTRCICGTDVNLRNSRNKSTSTTSFRSNYSRAAAPST